jgi:hypothetical protein
MAFDCVNVAACSSMWRGDEGHDPLHDEPDLHGEKHRVLQPRARATEPVSGEHRVLQPRARATETVSGESGLLRLRARAAEQASGEPRVYCNHAGTQVKRNDATTHPQATMTVPVLGEKKLASLQPHANAPEPVIKELVVLQTRAHRTSSLLAKSACIAYIHTGSFKQ